MRKQPKIDAIYDLEEGRGIEGSPKEFMIGAIGEISKQVAFLIRTEAYSDLESFFEESSPPIILTKRAVQKILEAKEKPHIYRITKVNPFICHTINVAGVSNNGSYMVDTMDVNTLFLVQ